MIKPWFLAATAALLAVPSAALSQAPDHKKMMAEHRAHHGNEVDIAAAVSAPARTPANIALDASRKPVELLRFLGIRKGAQVLDPFGGNLYWAEITAPAIGPQGRVTIWSPEQFVDDKARAALAAFEKAHPNVAHRTSRFEQPDFGKSAYDFALINLDYHDVYWKSEKYKIERMEPQAWLKVLFDAMKPGGIVGVVDHIAKSGSDPRVSVEAAHRIDPAVVRADFEKAGFRFVDLDELYRNAGDDLEKSVFDPAIRGRTDRFAYKFVKPAK